MSVSSVGSNKDLAYLQSLLQQGSSGISDPLASLFSAFTGANGGQPSASSSGGAAPVASGACGPQFSSDTLGAMISLQSNQAGSSGSLFAKFDTDGDGKISQTEFENAIGPNADKSLVDSLFQKIDSDGDGGITQDELTSAQNTALNHAHHHHHHMDGGGQEAGAGSGGLNDLLSGSGVAGAKTQTVSNPDGSSTTTITYADGSTVSTSTPDPQSSGGGSGNSSGSQNADSSLIEQLIKMQSQLINAATNVISAIA
jgi:hypothetical protein